MKGFPFVLGTDIFHTTRLDPINKSSVFVSIAKRVLHPKEIPKSTTLPTRAGLSRSSHESTPLHGEGLNRSLREWLTMRLSKAEHQEASKGLPVDKAAANRAARFLAGRWAAKEAARKAWGASLLSWKDVTVRIDHDIPSLEGTSRAVKIVCQPHTAEGEALDESEVQLNLRQEGRLSISHDGEYCVATVIAQPLREDIFSVFKNRASLIAERKGRGWKRSEVATTDDPDEEETSSQQEVDDHETSQDENK